MASSTAPLPARNGRLVNRKYISAAAAAAAMWAGITAYKPKKYYFKEYSLGDGYKYAVCGLSPCFEGAAETVRLGIYNKRIDK